MDEDTEMAACAQQQLEERAQWEAMREEARTISAELKEMIRASHQRMDRLNRLIADGLKQSNPSCAGEFKDLGSAWEHAKKLNGPSGAKNFMVHASLNGWVVREQPKVHA